MDTLFIVFVLAFLAFTVMGLAKRDQIRNQIKKQGHSNTKY